MQSGARKRKLSECITSPTDVADTGHQYGPATIAGHASVIQGDVHHHHQYSSGTAEYQHRTRTADWYSRTDFADQQDDQIRRREQGTGRWFLAHSSYQNWCDHANVTLFCPGIPGSGKSMMAATVVDDLHARFDERDDVVVVYLYCNFNRKAEQDFCHMLRVLIRQLFQEQSEVPLVVEKLYHKHRDRATQPSESELKHVLRHLVQLYHRVFIVIDALDECHNTSQERDKLLAELFALQTRNLGCVNLLGTSRPIPEIKQRFLSCPEIEIRAHNDDLELYLTRHIEQLPRFVLQDEQLQNQIKRKIIEAAEGMFLLARLQFDSLGDKLTPRKLKDGLAHLDKGYKGLDSAYNDALVRIDHQRQGYRDLARKVLLWITYAKRELSIEELQEAITIEPGWEDLDPEDLTDADDIVTACQGLVEIDQQSRVLRLVHYTTQEYFMRVREQWLPNGDMNIVTSCIAYLSMGVFAHDKCDQRMDFSNWVKKYKLLEYAGKNWGLHARALTDEKSCTEISTFLKTAGCAWFAGQFAFARWNVGQKRYDSDVTNLSGLHVSAFFGLEQVTREILCDSRDTNQQDSNGYTPLYWAVREGHTRVVQLLLSRLDVWSSGGVNTRTLYGGTPLSVAATYGNTEIVQLLLARPDIDVNTRDMVGETPLSCATYNRHTEIIQLLLARSDLEVNARDGHGVTLLFSVALLGHTRSVELLLIRPDLRLDVEYCGHTPLTIATKYGHSEIVELLSRRLSQGAIAERES